MLIKALCDYYDILSKNGKILSDEYSPVNINYIVCLTGEGKIESILENEVNSIEIMPKRSEKSSICSNIIEHRPLYIFGLNFDSKNKVFTVNDKTNKAKKSHNDFVEKNINFLEGLDSPVINAYRNFILNWNPEEETENKYLLNLGKKYTNSNFAFCLSGDIFSLLHNDDLINNKWKLFYNQENNETKNNVLSQCAITGENSEISRIHDKIKGIVGGQSSGCVMVGFNNNSECSYGNEQSYNSNISETSMRKYTKALNYILNSKNNKKIFDDITVIYWVMSDKEKYNDIMSMFVFNESMDEKETDNMLKEIIKDAKIGAINPERVSSILDISTDVDFYMVGLKPNSSRLSLKFIYKRKFADILINIAEHQKDMQISEEINPVPFWVIKKELLSPNSTNSAVNPALISKIFESAIYGTEYPTSLLSTIIQRAKIDKNTDRNKKIDIRNNSTRAGIIKACLNRKSRIFNKKEEIKVALDKENKNPAYLCGRLFAVLEKLQQDASNNSLNTTIKDAYFSSAVSKPAIIFPKILKLAQSHIKKSEHSNYYNILIGEIIDDLKGEFPETLLLNDQGRFIIGYYQQYQNFFVKKENKEEE